MTDLSDAPISTDDVPATDVPITAGADLVAAEPAEPDAVPSALAPVAVPIAPQRVSASYRVSAAPRPPRPPAVPKNRRVRLTPQRLGQVKAALRLMSDGWLTHDAALASGLSSGTMLRRLCRDPNLKMGVLDENSASHLSSSLRSAWMQAVAAQALSLGEKLLRIGEGKHLLDENGVSTDTMVSVQRDKLYSDNLKWSLPRMARAIYGDKVEHTGTVTHRAVVELPPIRDDSPPLRTDVAVLGSRYTVVGAAVDGNPLRSLPTPLLRSAATDIARLADAADADAEPATAEPDTP